MKIKINRFLYEIAVIVALSIVVAILYNFFSKEPLPLIREIKKVDVVSDSLLKLPVAPDTLKTNQFDPSVLKNDVQTEKTDTKNDEKPNSKPVKKEPEKPASNPEQSSNLKTITYKQLLKNLNNPGFLIIDARNAEEFKAGNIPNSINIFAFEPDQNVYFSSITKLPADKIIIVYCDGGNCDASHKLATDIMSFGFKKVFLYSGGWDEWTKMKRN